MSSRGTLRNSRVASQYSVVPTPTRFPRGTPGITTPSMLNRTKKILTRLSIAKTREYQKRKRQIVHFTERVLRKKIGNMIKKYINNNGDTLMDFITQLNYHPSVNSAFIVEAINYRRQNGVRILIDVLMPKSSLPTDTNNPLPQELNKKLQTNIRNMIMEYSAPSTSALRNFVKKRIILDIFHDGYFRVTDIKPPVDIWFSPVLQYYSTFIDPSRGIRSDDTGLESIAIVEAGLSEHIILSILENLNGTNFCATPAFKKICEKIRGNLNQREEDLQPFITFPEQGTQLGPEMQNTNPMINGIIENKINMYDFIPVLLSNYHKYLIINYSKEHSEVKKINTILKTRPTAMGTSFGRTKDFKVAVSIHHIQLYYAAQDKYIFNRFLTSDAPEKKNIKNYFNYIMTRHNFDLDDNDTFTQLTYNLLRAFVGVQTARYSNIQLRYLDARRELRHVLFIHLNSRLAPVIATPTAISPSQIFNIPSIPLSRIPEDERVVSAELMPDTAGKKKYKRKTSRRRKSGRKPTRRKPSRRRKSGRKI
tara:strand:+ start:1821 stop:3428 length:1608 start_codon:yes stop_codon:yes gene_type:complete